jgi:hypothetical protein
VDQRGGDGEAAVTAALGLLASARDHRLGEVEAGDLAGGARLGQGEGKVTGAATGVQGAAAGGEAGFGRRRQRRSRPAVMSRFIRS